ncbi:MAG: 6-phosphogluconolactonase [Wenzhouxiangellaceae bacterium]
MQWIEHPDFQTLTTTVARSLASACAEGIEQRGRATLALAGGSTPMPVYRQLAAHPLEWRSVSLMPGDERWVTHDHPACNLRAIREAFAGSNPEFKSLTPENPDGEPSLDAASAALSDLNLPFDACVLGMGGDGHFASLFPGAPELEYALNPEGEALATIVHPDPMPEDAPFARISLTLAAIAASRRLMLLIRGERKREVLKNATGSGLWTEFPVAALLTQPHLPLEIHWSP